MIPQHLSTTQEHYSPPELIEAARYVMGGIDLDPASCAAANRVVGSAKYFREKQDGLSKKWSGRVWLNPPGGSLVLRDETAKALGEDAAKKERERLRAEYHRWGTRSRSVAWWRKLSEEFMEQRVEQAVFLGFTLEILRSSQVSSAEWVSTWRLPMDFTLCFPSERQEFKGGDPTHANVLVYLGPNVDRFKRVFGEFGRCV